MSNEYVEQRDGGYFFIGSRVSLDSVVHQFMRGESPEAIVQAFPSLSLEQAYGGITFYLAHRDEIDTYFEKSDARFKEVAQASRHANSLLYAKLDAARRVAFSRR